MRLQGGSCGQKFVFEVLVSGEEERFVSEHARLQEFVAF